MYNFISVTFWEKRSCFPHVEFGSRYKHTWSVLNWVSGPSRALNTRATHTLYFNAPLSATIAAWRVTHRASWSDFGKLLWQREKRGDNSCRGIFFFLFFGKKNISNPFTARDTRTRRAELRSGGYLRTHTCENKTKHPQEMGGIRRHNRPCCSCCREQGVIDKALICGNYQCRGRGGENEHLGG